jgi:ABC-type lipoprotein export system ATPase subunit
MSVLVARDLVKAFRGGDGGVVPVLSGVNLTVARGEMIAVVGASGAGKSTLLHVIGALDRPSRCPIARTTSWRTCAIAPSVSCSSSTTSCASSRRWRTS